MPGCGERARNRRFSPEPGEGKVQRGRAHLGADALALIPLPQPGAGSHLAADGELPAAERLLPHHRAVAEHGEQQRPVPRCLIGQMPPVMPKDITCQFGGRLVGPGKDERHGLGWVDAVHREIGQVGQRLTRRDSQLQVRRAQPQSERREVVDQHPPMVAERWRRSRCFSLGLSGRTHHAQSPANCSTGRHSTTDGSAPSFVMNSTSAARNRSNGTPVPAGNPTSDKSARSGESGSPTL